MNGLPQPVPLDLVTVVTMLTGRAFGPELAHVFAAYMAIFLGACLGGAWSLSSDPPTSRVASVSYLVAVVLIAIFATVPAAEYLQASYPSLEVRWTLFPLAAVIAGIGKRWPDVIRWLVRLVRRGVEAWANAKTSQQDNGSER